MVSVRDKLTWRLTPGYYAAKLNDAANWLPSVRRVALPLVRALLPSHRAVGGKSERFDVDVADATDALDRDGFVALGRVLADTELRNIVSTAAGLMATDPWDESVGKFSLDRRPASAQVATYARSDIAANELVMELANDPTVLALMKRFLGAVPTLSEVSMWWSFPGMSSPKQAQLFHRDRDDLKFCKMFYYITDVDMASGPHVYVRGSARDARLRESRRLSDQEVLETFGADRIEYVCAPAGSAFLVDTSGIHKGLLPTSNPRLLLQFEYSLLPIGRERYDRDTRIALSPDLDRYVNRLFARGGGFFRVPRE